ncbi:hypothetical protein predicted by Glimmer/Critica [Lactiplantibacillus plantarum]|nr:hypothetical protein predicted by Glimmer/Critica [Lactiplantibacillus plantarum]
MLMKLRVLDFLDDYWYENKGIISNESSWVLMMFI